MAQWIIVLAIAFLLYTYLGYPLLLLGLKRIRGTKAVPDTWMDDEWPTVSITVPVYNEEHQIEETVQSLLALDYPADRKQILFVSDASSDGTDEIIRSFRGRGVELVRQPERRGKTAAEETAAQHLRGEIVINTDASIRIRPEALRRIVAPFADPSIGLASGRDISVAVGKETNLGESGYVGYEMWVRDLETAVEGIVGASGCFYAIRRELHGLPLPVELSRDFAAALNTRERGLRPVSVPSALAVVPRTPSLRREYHRKVRTLTRGMETLIHKRKLLNPLRFGLFSWMLFSHKICRWALPWLALAALVALGFLAAQGVALATVLLALGLFGIILGVAGWTLGEGRSLSPLLTVPAFGLMANVAVLRATLEALSGNTNPVWEPTRRAVT